MYRYSLARYSLPSKAEHEFYLAPYFVESMQGMIGIGTDVGIEGRFAEALKGKTVATPTAPIVVSFAERAKSAVQMKADYPFTSLFQGSVLNMTWIVKNTAIATEFTDTVEAQPFIGKNLFMVSALDDGVLCYVFGSKNILLLLLAGEIISSRVGVATITEERAYLNVTIPPGGQLVMDSELYLITLNGKNVMHLHSGDWISLDRDILSITVDSTTGGKLTGKLLYSERYL